MPKHSLSLPHIILKWAQTADGFIARLDYSSKWISSEASRKRVHEWRRDVDAIAVGPNTVRFDDPELTVRYGLLGEKKPPVRVVIDRNLTLTERYNVFDEQIPTLVLNSIYEGGQSENLRYVKYDGTLADGFARLGSLGIRKVLVEGGSQLLSALIESGLWHEARVFTSGERFQEGIPAPMIHGIEKARETIDGDTLVIWENPQFDEGAVH